MRSRLAWAAAAVLAVACSGSSTGVTAGRASPSSTPVPSPTGPPAKAYCLTDADKPEFVYFHGMWGALVGAGPTGVVLTNESGNDPCNWKNLVPALEQAGGFRVLLYFYGQNLDEDIQVGSDLLRDRGSTHVAIAGASLGGAATLVAGSMLRPQPSAVVSLSGEPDVRGENAARAVGQLTAPTLIVASEDDYLLTGAAARTLFAGVAAADKKLQVYPGGEHGTQLLGGDHAAEALPLVVQFLQSHSSG